MTYFYKILSVLLLLFIIGGCNITDFKTAFDTNNETKETEQILIGALLPLTGDRASRGETVKEALLIAEKNINENLSNSGINKKLNLMIEDTGSDPETALKKLKQLEQWGINTYIGPHSSEELKEIQDYSKKKDYLILAYASRSPQFSIKDNIFRLSPNSTKESKAITALLKKDKVKVIIPVWRDDAWGRGILNSTQNEFQNNGVKMLGGISYPPDTNNYTEIIEFLNQKYTEYKGEKIGILLISYDESENIIKEAAKHNNLRNAGWYGTSGVAKIEALINDTSLAEFVIKTNLRCPTYGLDDYASNKREIVAKEIKNKLGYEADIYSFNAYDSLWLATMVNLTEKGNISNKLKMIADNHFGLTGWTKLDEYGDREYANYDYWTIIKENNDYKWKRFERYISSLDIANNQSNN